MCLAMLAARWTVIVYAVNATFWEWSTEIRTDFLLVPLWLIGVSLLFSPRPHLDDMANDVDRTVSWEPLFG